jgi:hypothetical protein
MNRCLLRRSVFARMRPNGNIRGRKAGFTIRYCRSPQLTEERRPDGDNSCAIGTYDGCLQVRPFLKWETV